MNECQNCMSVNFNWIQSDSCWLCLIKMLSASNMCKGNERNQPQQKSDHVLYSNVSDTRVKHLTKFNRFVCTLLYKIFTFNVLYFHVITTLFKQSKTHYLIVSWNVNSMAWCLYNYWMTRRDVWLCDMTLLDIGVRWNMKGLSWNVHNYWLLARVYTFNYPMAWYIFRYWTSCGCVSGVENTCYCPLRVDVWSVSYHVM